jgi:excisionase family DNA binding protein
MGTKPKPPDAPAALQDRLITVPEACGILGCGNTTGWLLLKQGLLPPVRCGARATRVRLSDVNRLINTGWSLTTLSR